ncbi:hypothetical protein CSAL01_08476 [Colletotrichum salicis]|uniref:Uncharacterized protein n=1 Tax=Colletotrichum salicis TaxID=1209931 RepID=A0A135UHF9_9PEZI|nr:hypothetical protein CSAL01_08476 [Colletotrichum salicis]
MGFKPIVEEIAERSKHVDELAAAAVKAEIRDLHGVKTSSLEFAADVFDVVLEHGYPVIWALSSIATNVEDDSRVPFVSGIIRLLISQTLALNDASAVTISQWFDVFERCVSSFQRLFIVLDINAIEAALEQREANGQLYRISDFMERIIRILQLGGGTFKVIVVSWRFGANTYIDAESVFDDRRLSRRTTYCPRVASSHMKPYPSFWTLLLSLFGLKLKASSSENVAVPSDSLASLPPTLSPLREEPPPFHEPPHISPTGYPLRPPHLRPPHLRPPPFPRFKATKDAEWQKKLQARRTKSAEACSKEAKVGITKDAKVDSHRHDDEKEHAVEVQTIQEGKSPDHDASVAETLASLTEKQLGIDVLDEGKEVSTFLSYLLDTIQIMEKQLRYRAAANSLSDPNNGSCIGSANDSQDGEGAVSQGFQVIHRILCAAKFHNHDGRLYEDSPVTRKATVPGHQGWLQAEKEIFHLETWLSKRPSLCFIVIKEHRCTQDQRAEHQSYMVRDYYTGAYSNRLEKLKVVSPVLHKALRQVAEFPVYHSRVQDEFATEMEAPYLFLFHH